MAEVKRILVVDDHFRILDSVKSMLETSGKGYEVVGVPSAEEGILEIQKEPIDLLITDIYLPGMSGGELIVRANKLWPDLPIIVITGHAEKMGREEAAKSGIVHYFKKPMEPEAFLAAVHSAINTSDWEDDRPSDEASRDDPPDKMLAVGLFMESLRAESGAREVLLASWDGDVIYATGGHESSLSVLAPAFADTVRDLFYLAERMGSEDPHIYQHISDRQFQLHFATDSSDYYIAVLYYAQTRNQSTDSVWTNIKQALENILRVLHEDHQADLSVASVEHLESKPEDDSGENFSLPAEGAGLIEGAVEKVPEVANLHYSELPEIDETVDLDAFWDEALAVELDGEESGEGLNFDEARKKGLIPPEFDPGTRSPD